MTSNQARLAAIALSAAVFAALFAWSAPAYGTLLVPVALVPVIIAALSFGVPGGLVSAAILGGCLFLYAGLLRLSESLLSELVRVVGLIAVGAVVGRLHDLSVQLRRESAGRQAALKESDDKSRFIATMSHELRTPLNAILGFAQLLQRPEMDPLSERQQRYVANIISGGKDLAGLVDDVLGFAKLSQGEVRTELKPVLVGEVVDKVLVAYGPAASAKAICLVADVDREARAATDATQLERVLLNLVGNAIKFTPSGSVTVAARRESDEVLIEVADTGIGIAAEDFGRIFQPFQQVSEGTVRAYDGVGLGLAIVETLVHSLGGRIEVASEPGRGSTFSLALPAAGGSGAPLAPPSNGRPAVPA